MLTTQSTLGLIAAALLFLLVCGMILALVRLRPKPHSFPFNALIALALAGLIATAGCAQTGVLRKTDITPRPPGSVRVLLMPLDVELSELTAGGMLEPRADWTEQAKAHVRAALEEALRGKRAALVLYNPPAGEPEQTKADRQLLELHDLVAGAILRNGFVPLPTKKGRFDWSLGDGVKPLHERTKADYALFVLLRDSYASAGRVALMVGSALIAPFTGTVVPGGTQVGIASLVDLRGGEIVWFNRLSSGSGDLRTPEAARRAITNLLKELPL